VADKNVLLYGDNRRYEMLVITTRLQDVTFQRTTIYIFSSKALYALLSYTQKLHISGLQFYIFNSHRVSGVPSTGFI